MLTSGAEVAGVIFQTPTPLLFQNVWIRVRIRVRLFFKFVSPTPVQTPATMIDQTVIYPCFYLRNDRISCSDSGYNDRSNRNLPMFLPKKWPHRLLLLPNCKSDSGSRFSQILTPDPGPKEKHRILPKSTSAIRIRSHLCSGVHVWRSVDGATCK